MPDIAITRRNLLQATAAPVLLHASQPGNPTVEENQRPGTAEWQLRHYSFDSGRGSGLRSPRLEGYCSETSVYPGETIRFLVSTDPPRPFVMDFYRTGYYGAKAQGT